MLSDGLWNKIIVEGIMIGILTLVAFSIGNKYYGLEVGRTMAFLSIGFLELVHSFNIKNEKSIFDVGLFENKYLTSLCKNTIRIAPPLIIEKNDIDGFVNMLERILK